MWTTLKEHKDDSSLDSEFASFLWNLGTVKESYRYFRIIQTGKNKFQPSEGVADLWSDVLVAGGFELFGTLTEKFFMVFLWNISSKIISDRGGEVSEGTRYRV